MKKFITLAIALAATLSSACYAICPNRITGTWNITWENDKPLGDIDSYLDKTYYPDGKFNVCQHKRINKMENGSVYSISVVQKGQWEMLNDSTIIEKCQWGNKGNVGIHFTMTDDNTLVETFAFVSNPSKVYVQKLESTGCQQPCVRNVDTAQGGHIDGIGSWGQVNTLVYFIEDKRYNNYDDFKAALPADTTMIESFSVLKDGSALETLTDEEKAAGKTGVMRVHLKK